jgi:hypothetical protein
LNTLLAVSGKGRMRFMATEKSGATPAFIDFLNWLPFKQEKPTHLIVDGHPAHKRKKVKER